MLSNRKGVVLILTTLAIVLVLALSGTFFMRSVSEKRIADREKFNMQASFLAEAGANHALSELRERIREDLLLNIQENVKNSSIFRTYIENEDSLGLLRDYAYTGSDAKFTISGGKAVLTLSALDLINDIQGTYNAEISIGQSKDPLDLGGDVYEFYYSYAITGTGMCSAVTPNLTKEVILSGDEFTVTLSRDSIAKYALFTNRQTMPDGKTNVWFTANTKFYGPVHTNGQFNFANNPSGTFSEEVTQAQEEARFYDGGSNRGKGITLDADRNGNLDVPIFEESFERGVSEIDIESSLSAADLMEQALGTMPEPGSKGIYVPNEDGAVVGGIYIRGDVDKVEMGVDADNNPKYTIAQGSTTKIVTVDYDTDTTKVQTVGGSTETYSGIPNGVDNEGIIVFAKDNINSFYGTVQEDSVITVSSERSINITNNITYQEYNTSPKVNADGYDNMLGILAWGGDVVIDTSAPNDVQVHGIVMAPRGVFTVEDYNKGSPQGTATLLGGAITDSYGAFGTFSGTTLKSGYSRNFVYDERVLSGITPPYFPFLQDFVSQEEGLKKRPLWSKN